MYPILNNDKIWVGKMEQFSLKSLACVAFTMLLGITLAIGRFNHGADQILRDHKQSHSVTYQEKMYQISYKRGHQQNHELSLY